MNISYLIVNQKLVFHFCVYYHFLFFVVLYIKLKQIVPCNAEITLNLFLCEKKKWEVWKRG